jgi:uncharacterized protein
MSHTHTNLLSHFFTNQTLIDVFLFFLLNPQEETYLAHIVSSTGKGLIQVQRTLKRLLETGLIYKTIRHKKTYYKADQQHIAYDDVKNLVLKAKIFSDAFKEDIDFLKTKVDYGFIYGSVAKGTCRSESDIDIFFVGNLTYYDTGSFVSHLSSALVQEVNVAIFSPENLRVELKNKNSFVSHVCNDPKIWLFGDKNEFEKLYR